MSSSPVTLSPTRKALAGVQYLFVAFGATVLVPLLVGLDPSTALFSAGVGTLLFHLVTKGKVPIFLGSSFAFIAPIIKATELYAWEARSSAAWAWPQSTDSCRSSSAFSVCGSSIGCFRPW